ncbi:hypothetical protein BD560DRAFT_96506 [Blakeslea trispora]|nr:hypothetical protein BD560DRAFT_96506 [Blakeslea trispora]
MSLSYIIDAIDPDMLAVYERVIPQEYFQLWQENEVEILVEAAEEATITSVVDEFLRHFSDSTKAAKKYVLSKYLELVDNEGTTEQKVINLLNQIFMLTERKDKYMQEADYVGFVKQLLLLVFEDTDLSIVIGETGAKCTVDVQKYNSDNFSGAANSTYNVSMSSSSLSASSTGANLRFSEKRNISPRKIDLRILGDDEQELAFSEFKSHDAKKALVQYQESKSLRLNHCIIKSNRLQQPVISINWEGWNGTMFQVVDCGGFCLAKKCADLLIPSDIRLVDSSLKNLVMSLFFWKSRLCTLNDFIYRQNNKAGSKRKRYEDMPHTLLSPKHR